MNYEDMIARMLAGLTVIRDVMPTAKAGAHSYVVLVPFAGGKTADDFSNSQATVLADNGWTFDSQMGLVFPVIG